MSDAALDAALDVYATLPAPPKKASSRNGSAGTLPAPPKMALGQRDQQKVNKIHDQRNAAAEIASLRAALEEGEQKQLAAITALRGDLAEAEKRHEVLAGQVAVLTAQVVAIQQASEARANATAGLPPDPIDEPVRSNAGAKHSTSHARAAATTAAIKDSEAAEAKAAFEAAARAKAATAGGRAVEEARQPAVTAVRTAATETKKAAASAATTEEELGWWDALVSRFRPREPEPEKGPEPACYLLFTEASGGAFITHWSEAPVDGALASFVPARPVPKFKYTNNGGRSELCRGVGGPNKKLFYAGWISFIRTAFSHNARFAFLCNVGASPVAIFIGKKDTAVQKLEQGIPTQLHSDAIAAVAVVHELEMALDVLKMPTRLFTSVGDKQGAAFSLDGGGDGRQEDVRPLSARRSSDSSNGNPEGGPTTRGRILSYAGEN